MKAPMKVPTGKKPKLPVGRAAKRAKIAKMRASYQR